MGRIYRDEETCSNIGSSANAWERSNYVFFRGDEKMKRVYWEMKRQAQKMQRRGFEGVIAIGDEPVFFSILNRFFL